MSKKSDIDMEKSAYDTDVKNNEKKTSEKADNIKDNQGKLSADSRTCDSLNSDKSVEEYTADKIFQMEKRQSMLENELSCLKKECLINFSLIAMGAKNLKAVKALLDMDKLSFEKDSVLGLEEQIERLKSASDSSFLFGSGHDVKIVGGEPVENMDCDDIVIPLSKASVNLTEQGKLYKSNPSLAKKIAKNFWGK